MSDVLVRNIDDRVIKRLKVRAQEHNRSLQAELQTILATAAAQAQASEIKRLAAKLRRQLAECAHTDSAKLLVEDRTR